MSALSDLVYRAVTFANWAAGEGICPESGQDPERNPDEFLMMYSNETDVEDWDGLAAALKAEVEALEATQTPPLLSQEEAFQRAVKAGMWNGLVSKPEDAA